MVQRSSSEYNSIEHDFYETPNMYSSLSTTPLNAIPLRNQQQFKLDKINKIKYYFVAEIKGR